MYIQRRRITANADVDGETTVAPEASDLLFEAEDESPRRGRNV